jgi:hypothetical protein
MLLYPVLCIVYCVLCIVYCLLIVVLHYWILDIRLILQSTYLLIKEMILYTAIIYNTKLPQYKQRNVRIFFLFLFVF